MIESIGIAIGNIIVIINKTDEQTSQQTESGGSNHTHIHGLEGLPLVGVQSLRREGNRRHQIVFQTE